MKLVKYENTKYKTDWWQLMEINYDTQHAAGRTSYHEYVKMKVWINLVCQLPRKRSKCDFSLTFSIYNRVKANITYKDNRVNDEERDCQGGTATSWFSWSRLKDKTRNYSSQTNWVTNLWKNILKNILHRFLCISWFTTWLRLDCRHLHCNTKRPLIHRPHMYFVSSSPTKHFHRHLTPRQNATMVVTATNITQTGYSTRKSSNRSTILCMLWDACHELFCIFGDLYASGMQDAGVTKSVDYKQVCR